MTMEENDIETGFSIRKKCTTRHRWTGYRGGIDFSRYFARKEGIQYIRYEESSVTGLEGVKTTIKIYEDSIVLLRTGAVNMRHQYIRGEERESTYETPLGDLHMAVKTHELTVDFHDGTGRVHLGYDISIEGEWQFYNQLEIDVREDTEHGNEGNPEIGD